MDLDGSSGAASVLRSDTDAFTTTEIPPVRVKRVGKGGGACCPCFFLVALARENKEKWDESFSRARATRKKEGQRAPPPFPTCFSRTGGVSVVVTASVSDLCSCAVEWLHSTVVHTQCAQIWYRRSHNYRSTSCPWEASRERRRRALPFFLPRRSCTRERLVPLLLILLASSLQCYF